MANRCSHEQDWISSSKIHGILSSELRPVSSSGQTLSALLLPGSPLDQFGPVSDRFVGSVWLSDVLVGWEVVDVHSMADEC